MGNEHVWLSTRVFIISEFLDFWSSTSQIFGPKQFLAKQNTTVAPSTSGRLSHGASGLFQMIYSVKKKSQISPPIQENRSFFSTCVQESVEPGEILHLLINHMREHGGNNLSVTVYKINSLLPRWCTTVYLLYPHVTMFFFLHITDVSIFTVAWPRRDIFSHW